MANGSRLTQEQKAAIRTIVRLVENGEDLIALEGPAGSGKTTVIERMQRELVNVVVSAMTNKAADVLRRKGIVEAKTMHQAGLVAKYSEPGDTLYSYLRSEGPQIIEEEDILLDYFEETDLENAWNLCRSEGFVAATKLLGIADFFGTYFKVWAPREEPDGVLIVDEASMLGSETLKTLQESFSQIILVGDQFQLPPINDVRVFHRIRKNKVHLTQIHRQDSDSQSLSYANAIRNGEEIAMSPVRAIKLSNCRKRVPLIVWRNNVRITLTRKIRRAFGYTPSKPVFGEPIVSRENKRLAGINFTRNSIWQIVSREEDGKFVVGDGVAQETDKPITLRMEEFGETPGGAGLCCRFGYAMTCHMAQGSEWEKIMIHVDDATDYQEEHPEDAPNWLYTAITRAQKTVIWVANEIYQTVEQ